MREEFWRSCDTLATRAATRRVTRSVDALPRVVWHDRYTRCHASCDTIATRAATRRVTRSLHALPRAACHARYTRRLLPMVHAALYLASEVVALRAHTHTLTYSDTHAHTDAHIHTRSYAHMALAHTRTYNHMASHVHQYTNIDGVISFTSCASPPAARTLWPLHNPLPPTCIVYSRTNSIVR